ncbi:MAG: type IV toxin-antitoxin system AbiEi family antitoxin domain-containing protein [Solirubrobacterales bacterium]
MDVLGAQPVRPPAPGADPTELWRAIVALATSQHDLVTRSQLLALGMKRGMVTRRLRAGGLHRVHWGVYTLGTPNLTREGRWLAAVLACGCDAVLSHLSAGALLELLAVDPVVIDVSVSSQRRRRAGLRVHRRSLPLAYHSIIVDGVPVTTPVKTWFDLAAVVGTERLRTALSAGERDGKLDPVRLAALADAMPRQPGLRLARELLSSYLPMPAQLRSNLERTFWEDWRQEDHPEPELNASYWGEEVDVLWRDRALVLELDGWRYHRTSVDRARDEERDLKLARAGAQVLRISDVLVDQDIGGAISAIAEILDRRPVVASLPPQNGPPAATDHLGPRPGQADDEPPRKVLPADPS